jgi:hypothetical protein
MNIYIYTRKEFKKHQKEKNKQKKTLPRMPLMRIFELPYM